MMPPAFQAISVSILGIYHLYRSYQARQQPIDRHSHIVTSYWYEWAKRGFIFLTITHIAGASIHYYNNDISVAQSFKPYIRLIGKQGLWGLMTIHILLVRYQSYITINNHLAKQVLRFMLALLGYMYLQRLTGIDLVHGISAKLADNRLANGVYRSSAFMAHPLTLGYCLMTCTLLFYAIASLPSLKAQKKLWLVCTSTSFFSLLLTQSRYPIAITSALILVDSVSSFKLPKLRAIILSISILGAGWWAIHDRVLELTTAKQSIEQSIPRVTFWKVHWNMFLDHPYQGVGLPKSKLVSLDYYEKLGYNNAKRKYSAHNIYLQTLADQGLIGFIGLMSLIICLGIGSWQEYRNKEFKGFLILYISVIAGGFLQNHLRDSEYLASLWIAHGLLILATKGQSVETRSQVENF